MKCPFCKFELWTTGMSKLSGEIIIDYACNDKPCLMNEFPRYKCSSSSQFGLIEQTYVLMPFYVQVYKLKNITKIFKLNYTVLEDEVFVEGTIWLNPTNYEETLDKLKMCITFS